MLGDDVLELSTGELANRIKARKLSPVELTESYLARIARHNGQLNAFETLTEDLALAQARAAESEIGAGRYRGPLHGIPYGAKDLLATAGIRTGWGARPTRDQVFDADATVIRKLREAGAVLLGKLAMVELAGGLGYRFAGASVSGPGRNPWDTSRWTGGSSSGSGAAVAAALVGFAIGTETWGSILCPSAFCGITGLRPTYGRVSRAGAMACSWSYDKIGPLARAASDCRLVLQAIAGPDPDDPSSSSEPVRLEARDAKPLKQVRAARIPLDFAKGGEREVETAFDRAVDDLRAAGLRIVDAELPVFPAAEVAGVLIAAEAISSFETLYRNGRVHELSDTFAPYQPDVIAPVSGADLVKAWRMRRALQEEMARFFGRYDVIVTPNFTTTAPLVSADLTQALASYTDPVGAVGNTCGLPAIALPCGFGQGHMPIGFQIVAAPFEEATLLSLGELYQQRTGFHRERPALAAPAPTRD
ncbi:MAG TPA: amidase [Candidatus Limnocylindria bacterium]|nr:amidase [Candidatus Limnocylindria bacterium]